MRYLGEDDFQLPGAAGAFVVRPPEARYAQVITDPPIGDEVPVPAGADPIAHVVVVFSGARSADEYLADAILGALPPRRLVRGGRDLSVEVNQPFLVPDCGGLAVGDGGAAGATPIDRGVVVWFAED